MSGGGQKRSEQKSRVVVPEAPARDEYESRGARPLLRLRPGQPRTPNTAFLQYLTRNSELFRVR